MIALEKGIEFFYEIFFYSLIVGIAGYEMLRVHQQGEEKKVKEEQVDENTVQAIHGNIINGFVADQENLLSNKIKLFTSF